MSESDLIVIGAAWIVLALFVVVTLTAIARRERKGKEGGD